MIDFAGQVYHAGFPRRWGVTCFGALHRREESYVTAGLEPAPVLQIATYDCTPFEISTPAAPAMACSLAK